MNADILAQSGQVTEDVFDAFMAELVSDPQSPRTMAELKHRCKMPGWVALLRACCAQGSLYTRSGLVSALASVQLRSGVSAPQFWAHLKEHGVPEMPANGVAEVAVAYAHLHCSGKAAQPDIELCAQLRAALRDHVAAMSPSKLALCARAQQLLTHGANAPAQPVPRRSAAVMGTLDRKVAMRSRRLQRDS